MGLAWLVAGRRLWRLSVPMHSSRSHISVSESDCFRRASGALGQFLSTHPMYLISLAHPTRFERVIYAFGVPLSGSPIG